MTTRGAIGGPRLLLRRLREVMAEPVTPQARLDKIVVHIASNMVAEVCSVYVLREDGRLELFATEGLKREAVHQTTLRIGEHETVTVAVPVVFTDEDESGIKQGGVLNVTRHEIELVVDAANIPTEISISLKGLAVGDSIHISDVKLPKGAEPAIDDRDFAIATIVPPTVPTAEDEAADAEAQAEGSEEA